MGIAKEICTRQMYGEKINYNPKPRPLLVSKEHVVVKIPDGILDVNETEASIKKKKPKVNVKQQKAIIKKLEKEIQKRNRPKVLIKTASIKHVQEALGNKYKVERDKSYKCRRWIVSTKTKEWYIRYNDPLIYAVAFIEEYGAAKFLKEYTMESKYN